MIATLALWSVLSSTPLQVLIVRRSSAGVADTTVAAVMHAVGNALERQGLVATIDVLTCSGDPACLAAQARASFAAATVAVTIVKGRRQLTLDLEAVDDAERPLTQRTFSVPLSGEPLPEEGTRFVEEVAHALLAPLRPTDAPKVVELAPPPSRERLDVASAPPPTPLALRAAGGTTIALGAATVGLLIAGLVVKGGLDTQVNAGPVIQLTREQAGQQASSANGLLTASALGAALTAAAGITTGVLWLW
jgi:hypothetical protein